MDSVRADLNFLLEATAQPVAFRNCELKKKKQKKKATNVTSMRGFLRESKPQAVLRKEQGDRGNALLCLVRGVLVMLSQDALRTTSWVLGGNCRRVRYVPPNTRRQISMAEEPGIRGGQVNPGASIKRNRNLSHIVKLLGLPGTLSSRPVPVPSCPQA